MLLQKNMQIIKSEHNGIHTFAMIPAHLDCPYMEAVYLPDSKKLVVISKNTKDTFHFFPRIDDNGDQIPAKRRVANRNPYKEERKQINTFYEYYLSDQGDIKKFIEIHAHNPEDADTFLVSEPIKKASLKK